MKIEISGKQYQARTLKEVIEEKKPREVLVVGVSHFPSNVASIHYFDPLDKCKSFLKDNGIRVAFLEAGQIPGNIAGDHFRYLREGIHANVDFGLLYHGSPYYEYNEDNDQPIKIMAEIFPQNQLYIADPLSMKNEDFIQSCLSEVYKEKVKLRKMLVDIEF